MPESRFSSGARFWLRFWLTVILLVTCGVFLQFRAAGEDPRARLPLQNFPDQIHGWQGSPVPIAPAIRAVLGPGEFLERFYHGSGGVPPVDLFLAYFPSQRTGDTMHSPKNCLPGGGWVPIASGQIPLTGPKGKQFRVNRYLIAKGLDRMLVIYWFEEQGRPVASEYWAKIYLVSDSIRENRSDGALIRIATPLAAGELPAVAEKRAVRFAKGILPLLPAYIPH